MTRAIYLENVNIVLSMYILTLKNNQNLWLKFR